MTTPITDARVIPHMLQARPGAQADATARLQLGAELLILDAFDRKVTRENFIEILSRALVLVDVSGRTAAFEAAVGNENFKRPEICDGATETLRKEVAACADKCAQLAGLLAQCPRDADPIN